MPKEILWRQGKKINSNRKTFTNQEFHDIKEENIPILNKFCFISKNKPKTNKYKSSLLEVQDRLLQEIEKENDKKEKEIKEIFRGT